MVNKMPSKFKIKDIQDKGRTLDFKNTEFQKDMCILGRLECKFDNNS